MLARFVLLQAIWNIFDKNNIRKGFPLRTALVEHYESKKCITYNVK